MNTKTIHQEAEDWAAAASTGGLTEPELQAWHGHLAACAACNQLQQEHLAMARLVKQTLTAPDPGFEQRMLLKLNRTISKDGNRWYEYFLFRPGLLAMAASLAVAAIAGAGILVHNGKQTAVTSNAPAGMDGLPVAVRDAIRHEAAGKTIGAITRDDQDGEVVYTVETKTPGGKDGEFMVAADGTLLGDETAPEELPAAVKDAIKTQVAQGRLDGVYKTLDDNETIYVATITPAGGRQHDYTFAQDGTLQEMEADLGELPAPLQDAIKAKQGQGRLDGIYKTFGNGDTDYVATITSQDGRERDFTFGEDGALSSVEMMQDELPAVVQAALREQSGGGTLNGIDKTFDNGGVAYEASIITADGGRRSFLLSEEGKLLSREVAMNEMPEAVRQTVSRTLGDGKVIEVDQSFDEPDNVIPYEIEGRKDGKPVRIMVSATGELLSME